ncbi:5-formyltetrahydrofolate cyclo-ligase [Actinoplanes sp. NPDC026623]|uniref:5-formyltetrahydrofolate cyclo-ligase n=1 Tax=Actinoplanes sp. NPDC026623 TaxID=3155610 RepID=UPI0033DC8332
MPDFASEAEKSRTAKIALRDQLLAARRSLPPETRASAAAAVQAALQNLVRAQSPTIVAGYVPVGPEPGGADLPEMLAGRLILPVLLPDNDLDWVRYEGPDSLRPGPRGLREPIGPRLGPDAVARASLLVVPALAVDRSGLRMGRGGGSYDRALARAANAYSVALLHDGEFLASVPAQPHDRRVHAVITPAEGLSETVDWTK